MKKGKIDHGEIGIRKVKTDEIPLSISHSVLPIMRAHRFPSIPIRYKSTGWKEENIFIPRRYKDRIKRQIQEKSLESTIFLKITFVYR